MPDALAHDLGPSRTTSGQASGPVTRLEIVSDNNREEREGPAASYIVYDTNVEVHQKKMSDRKSGIAGKASNIHEASRGTTVPPPAMPPFDTATSVLGTRCAHGHTHGRTGQSLRNTHSGECGRCVAARQAKRRQTKCLASAGRPAGAALGVHQGVRLGQRRACRTVLLRRGLPGAPPRPRAAPRSAVQVRLPVRAHGRRARG